MPLSLRTKKPSTTVVRGRSKVLNAREKARPGRTEARSPSSRGKDDDGDGDGIRRNEKGGDFRRTHDEKRPSSRGEKTGAARRIEESRRSQLLAERRVSKGKEVDFSSESGIRGGKDGDGLRRNERGGEFRRTRDERWPSPRGEKGANRRIEESRRSRSSSDRGGGDFPSGKRVPRVKVDAYQKSSIGDGFRRNDRGGDFRRTRDEKQLRPRWEKQDAEKRFRTRKVDASARDMEDEGVGRVGEEDGEQGQSTERKRHGFQKRLLNVSGKKIRGHRKDSGVDDASSAVAPDSAPPRKRKRGIKLDPYDTSNKRLNDGFSENDKVVEKEKEIELSKNAQFRAIQPSPSILSFVEDNLIGRRRLNEWQNAGYNVKLPVPLDNIPFSTNIEREPIDENIFRNKLEFFAAAKISSSFPPPKMPEIAFAGRSNVGKSSLLNALTRRWGVVRVSDKPGLTQTINFFSLASKLSLVDLPGYGFAYAKEEVKDAWEELVKEYVSSREMLRRVCLLIDTKWGMKPRDHELIYLMERSKTPYQIVLTKTDAVFPIDVARRTMQIQEELQENKSMVNPVMMVSSKSGAGIRSLRAVLSAIRLVRP